MQQFCVELDLQHRQLQVVQVHMHRAGHPSYYFSLARPDLCRTGAAQSLRLDGPGGKTIHTYKRLFVLEAIFRTLFADGYRPEFPQNRLRKEPDRKQPGAA